MLLFNMRRAPNKPVIMAEALEPSPEDIGIALQQRRDNPEGNGMPSSLNNFSAD